MDTSHGDPTVGRPLAARPHAVLIWGGALYALVTAFPAGTLLFRAVREGGEPIVAWGMLCLCFALPVGVALGALAGGRERLVVGRVLAGRWIWAGYGVGVALAAHWLLLLAWTPVALIYVLVAASSAREEYLRSAVAGLLPWAAVTVGLVLIAGTRWLSRARDFRASPASWELILPPMPHALGTGAVAALLVGPTMLVGAALVAERGDGGGQALPMAAVLGGLGLIAGVAIAASGASAEAEAARNGSTPISWPVAFASYLGVFLVVQWGASLPLTLLPVWDDAVGQRFVFQVLAFFGIVLGTALAGRRLAGLEVAPSAG